MGETAEWSTCHKLTKRKNNVNLIGFHHSRSSALEWLHSCIPSFDHPHFSCEKAFADQVSNSSQFTDSP